jgi:hypothetical protein
MRRRAMPRTSLPNVLCVAALTALLAVGCGSDDAPPQPIQAPNQGVAVPSSPDEDAERGGRDDEDTDRGNRAGGDDDGDDRGETDDRDDQDEGREPDDDRDDDGDDDD